METTALEKLDSAIAELQDVRDLIVAAPQQIPSPDPAPVVPDKPAIIHLPKEGTRSLNSFYGTATRSGKDLIWFEFPLNNMRLYSRTGANISDRTGDGFDDHRCHKAIAPHLQAAYRELLTTLGVERFMKEGWHVYSGCFNYRSKRGGSNLSTHSWGIAVDVNDSENPFLSRKTTFSDEAINIMEKHGFLSGGRAWGKDWMHFQRAIPFVSSGSYYARNGLPDHIKQAA